MVNVKINFRGLDVAYFDVLEMGEKKYVLDSNSTTPKSYYWGFSPENLEVDLIELDSKNKNFDKKIKMGPSGMRMVYICFSLLLYRVVTSIFRYYDISHHLHLKVSLFLILHTIAFSFYMGLDDGTEAAILVLNGLLAYLFIWIESGVIPLTYAYQQKYLEFKELKKL